MCSMTETARYPQQRLAGAAASSTSGTEQIMPPRLTRVNEATLSLMPWAIEFQVAWAQAALKVAASTAGAAPAAPVRTALLRMALLAAASTAKPIGRPLRDQPRQRGACG